MLQGSQSEAEKYYRECKNAGSATVTTVQTGLIAPYLGAIRNFITTKLKEVFGKVGKKELKEAANRFHHLLKMAVHQQSYQWKPLNERYLAWKRKVGRDTRILLATHEYITAIEVIELPKKQGEMAAFSVGLPDRIHKDSGLPLKTLARIHEFGSMKRNIPPRPLWFPTWYLFSKDLKKHIAEKLTHEMITEFKKEMDQVAVPPIPGVRKIEIRKRT